MKHEVRRNIMHIVPRSSLYAWIKLRMLQKSTPLRKGSIKLFHQCYFYQPKLSNTNTLSNIIDNFQLYLSHVLLTTSLTQIKTNSSMWMLKFSSLKIQDFRINVTLSHISYLFHLSTFSLFSSNYPKQLCEEVGVC